MAVPRTVVIDDLDGTLYFQTPVRIRMALRLASHYGPRPGRWRELAVLRDFRREREADDAATDLDLTATLARRHRLPESAAAATLDRWLLREPLAAVAAHRDTPLAEVIAQAARAGIKIAVLSDYPTEAKMKALGIAADAQFCSTEPPIEARKPSPQGIETVLAHFGATPDQALMVGDRDSKDGAAARAAGVESLILPKGRRGRRAAIVHLRRLLALPTDT
ncbi:MAG: HAD family hydrolase [Bifidobacteriaceae bacterium]|jgi:FMN phosphatase YigB (HAD superfamily)|nr:HAD family hydrolase [Bifidobacteriaceae bacterium]